MTEEPVRWPSYEDMRAGTDHTILAIAYDVINAYTEGRPIPRNAAYNAEVMRLMVLEQIPYSEATQIAVRGDWM